MQIRTATAEESGAVTTLVRAAFQQYVSRIGREPGPMGHDYAKLVALGQVWVAVTGADLVGVLLLLPEADHLLLDTVAVRGDHQGKGIGRALIAFAEARARSLGFADIRLYAHAMMTGNLALYRRAGYAETARAEQDGFHRIFFRKAVA